MAVDHAHGGVKARIRNAEQADFPVVAGNVFDQPIDRIPGVGAFVRFQAVLGGIEGPHMDILTLRTVAPPDILGDQDKPVLGQAVEGRSQVGVIVRAVRLERVGRAGEENRPGLGDILGRQHPGEQAHPVPHRDAVFEFRVMLDQPGVRGGGSRVGRAQGRRRAQAGGQRQHGAEAVGSPARRAGWGAIGFAPRPGANRRGGKRLCHSVVIHRRM